MHSRIWTALAVLALLSLPACGGGGGGNGSTMPGAVTFDLAAGLANLSASTVTTNLTITGTVNGFDITQSSGQLSQSAAVAAAFNKAPAFAQAMTLSGTVTTSEITNLPLSFSIVQYDSNTYALLGLDTNYNSVPEYIVAESPLPFPSSVEAGDSGVIGILEVYVDSALKDFAGAMNVSFTVQVNPNSTDSVVVEITEQYVDTRNQPGQVFQYDYLLTTAGGMSLLSLTITYPASPGSPGDTLVLSAQ
jgi:hypothetical protein